MSAERLVDALLSEHPLSALAALRPALSGDLLAVAQLAERRLGPRVVPGSPEAELLGVVAGVPGLSAAALTERVGSGFAVTARALLEADLVTSRRFERPDCWTRTARGAAALRALDEA